MSLLLFLFACSSNPDSNIVPIEGTTARIDEKYKLGENTELDMVFMTTEEQCAEFFATQYRSVKDIGQDKYDRNMDACLPWIDRGAGEVKLSLRFELDGETYPMALETDDIEISHDNQKVEINPPDVVQRVKGHNPSKGDQLFILMIDASGSMAKPEENPRMDVVKKALKREGVMERFFPDEGKNHVVMYTFTSKVTPLGGVIKSLDNKEDYLEMVEKLQPRDGYTHLYDAVKYGIKDIPKEPEIKELLDGKIRPTLVLLTDGFNNKKPKDTCSTNVEPLQNLLLEMDEIRKKQDPLEKMHIVTIGFGRKLKGKRYFSIDRWKKKDKYTVRASHLCRRDKNGKVLRSERIDASRNIEGLEKHYIDNVSLAMIAEKGEGQTFVRKDTEGLGRAFEDAAAFRYQWFEVQYRQSPLKLRKDFDVRLKLVGFLKSMSYIKIYPSAWLDGPSGEKFTGDDGEEWSKRSSVWHSTTIFISGVGLFFFLSILGAAVFNVKRLLLGRLSRK